MKDMITIAEALNGRVRIHAACTTDLVNKARQAHHCMPTSTAALGRTLTATAIMASDLKSKNEIITATINGHGPAGTVLAQADGEGNVRGFIGDPNLYMVKDNGHLDVGKAVGTDGNLTITRDMGLKDTFSGVSQLQTGEIGDDFAYYFAVSEQTPSVVGVGVLVDTDGTVKAAGGLIYQLLPGADEEAIEFCEHVAVTQKPVSELIESGQDLESIIHTYFPDANILSSREVKWHCGCNREKFADSISTLHNEQIEEMINDGKGAEIVCQFCNTRYFFDTDELKEILKKKTCGK